MEKRKGQLAQRKIAIQEGATIPEISKQSVPDAAAPKKSVIFQGSARPDRRHRHTISELATHFHYVFARTKVRDFSHELVFPETPLAVAVVDDDHKPLGLINKRNFQEQRRILLVIF
jgi:hypothetical protein